MADVARDRVVRMLGLVSFLEAHGEASFSALARHFGVSEKQIKSDVMTLWTSGLPGYETNDLIDFNADLIDQDVASLTDGQGVTQIRLSARESVALLGALASFEASGAAPEAVRSAAAKLRTSLGAPAVATRDAAVLNAELMETLRQGIATQRTVHLTYVNASDQRTEREVEPHRLVAIADVAYLECFCRRAQGYRTLRAERILGAALGDDAVVTPASDEVGFELESVYQATVVLARSAVRAVEDLPGVTLTLLGDDVEARFGVSNIDVVTARLLSVAPWLRSVEPHALRDALAVRAATILEPRT